MSKTLTAANSVFILTLADIYPVPIKLEGYATDEETLLESVNPTETRMGVDGILSGGMVTQPIKQTIKLEATSDSNAVFDGWYTAQQTTKDAYRATAIIRLPSIGRMYTLTGGFLTKYNPMSGVKKLLEARDFEITWESVVGADI